MIFLAEMNRDHLNLLVGGVLGMILLSSALVIFFVVYQRRIFAQQQQREAEEKAHQQQLLVAAVEVQETERRRIAGDLHDEIGSLLSATRLYLGQLSTGATPEKMLAIKGQSLAIIDEMIQSTRRISHDLLPPALEKFGFQAAAEDLCEQVSNCDAITVNFHSLTDERVAAKSELALYRVLQELINNTIKHAGATTAEVTVKKKRTHFVLTYNDNGQGFDPPTVDRAGLGLRNIESRVALVGGSLETLTSVGKGLRVTIELPTQHPVSTHPCPPTYSP